MGLRWSSAISTKVHWVYGMALPHYKCQVSGKPHSSQMIPQVENGASCSAENEGLSAVKLKIVLLFYFYNSDQLQRWGNNLKRHFLNNRNEIIIHLARGQNMARS